MGWGTRGTTQGYPKLSSLEKQNFSTRILDFEIFDMSDFGNVPGYLGVGIWAECRKFDRIFSRESHFGLFEICGFGVHFGGVGWAGMGWVGWAGWI